jgi:hypothetical protein
MLWVRNVEQRVHDYVIAVVDKRTVGMEKRLDISWLASAAGGMGEYKWSSKRFK